MIPSSEGTGVAEAREVSPRARLNVKVRNFMLIGGTVCSVVGAQSRTSGLWRTVASRSRSRLGCNSEGLRLGLAAGAVLIVLCLDY